MSLFAKIKNKINSIKNEHIPLCECMSDVEELLELENKSHREFLQIVADIAIEKYGLHIFSLLIANQVRAISGEFDYTDFSAVDEWAYSYDEISNLPCKVWGLKITELSFVMRNCSNADINFLAEICIDKLRERYR